MDASRRVETPKSVLETCTKSTDSFLSDSFIRGQDLTNLYSYNTPTRKVLRAPIVHSTEVKSKSSDINLQQTLPPLLSFTPVVSEQSQGASVADILKQIPRKPHSTPTTKETVHVGQNSDKDTPKTSKSRSAGSSANSEQNLGHQYRPLAINMDSLAKCSNFYGYPQDNGKKFMSEFESFADLHGLGTFDKRRLAAFHLHLKGPALTWYDSLEDQDKSSWKIVHDLFTKKYVTLTGHGANMLMHSEIFQNLFLSPGQSIEDFYCQIYEKGKLISKPEHEMLSKFVSGLPHDLSYFVRAGMPQDMQTALASAKMGEAYGYRIHDESVNAVGMFRPKPKPRDTTADQNISESQDLRKQVADLKQLLASGKVDNLENYTPPTASASPKSEISELKDQIQTLTSMVFNMSVQNKPRSYQNTGQNSRRPRHDFSDSRSNEGFNNREQRQSQMHSVASETASMNTGASNTQDTQNRTINREGLNPRPPMYFGAGPNVTCFSCKGYRHYQRDCNWNGAGKNTPNETCQLCMQQGHTANLCITLTGNVSGNMSSPGDRHGRPV